MYQAAIYDEIIQSKSMRGLKIQASKIANKHNNTIDKMELVISNGYALVKPVDYFRIGGKWK